MSDTDRTEELAAAVKQAHDQAELLRIRGSGSKSFYGNPSLGSVLDVTGHRGVVSYESSELVITARCGTPVAEIEQTLSAAGQMLGFEPPHYGPAATIGGTIACGFSGPRRPFAGAARDFVLGVKCINGKGEPLAFGGQVIKNVAGYDVSRLMTGALGTLGLLSEVSLKVLPKGEVEVTRVREVSEQVACEEMLRIARLSLPVTAMSYCAGRLRVRLEGTENAVRVAEAAVAGEADAAGHEFWDQLKEHKLDFFNREQTLWRLSLPATAAAMNLGADCIVDWGGALRWIYTDRSAQDMFALAQRLGGHATLFRTRDHDDKCRFSALSMPMLKIHRRLKEAFDPLGILNRSILHPEI